MTQQYVHQPVIMVVDDDYTLRSLCVKYLKKCDYNVVQAEDGQAGIDLFQSAHPDLILLDVNMPKASGFEVCKAIRQTPRGADIPIVMMTGADDMAAITHAFDLGATDFVTKPINWVILSQRMRYMLRANVNLIQLKDSEMRLEHAQRIARLGHWEWKPSTDEVYLSDELITLLAFPEQTERTNIKELLARICEADRDTVKQSIQTAIREQRRQQIEFRVNMENDLNRIIHQQVDVDFDAKDNRMVINATLQDVTKQRETEEEMRRMAHYDTLTGLPNRAYFSKLLERALAHAERAHEQLAVLFLDMDRFKQINDTLGHTLGDSLLKVVAKRIANTVRAADVILSLECEEGNDAQVARVGGDEFTILLTGIGSSIDAAKVARRIIKVFEDPLLVDSHEILTSTSVGISVYPNDGDTQEALIKNADMAMYYAKNRGRNNFEFYSEPMNARAVERFNLERSLQKAVEREELFLHYQPKLNLNTNTITGVEALVRWKHPELQMLMPSEFITLAEETGLIVPISEWIIDAACKQMKTWLETQAPIKHVAVNLSPQQFLQPGLVRTVRSALTNNALDGKYLILEVTETIFMNTHESTIHKLNALKEMGIIIALDDFGTGYSSLSYIKRFPIDIIKIDQTFIKDIPLEEDSKVLTRTIIAMAKCLGLSVTAEGVETLAQLQFLIEEGCDEIQGYYISAPDTPEHVIHLTQTETFDEFQRPDTSETA